jgi:hypothetical protein
MKTTKTRELKFNWNYYTYKDIYDFMDKNKIVKKCDAKAFYKIPVKYVINGSNFSFSIILNDDLSFGSLKRYILNVFTKLLSPLKGKELKRLFKSKDYNTMIALLEGKEI